MLGQHWVRYGVLGHVGCFAAAAERHPRGTRVICRTERGLEVGEVLAQVVDGEDWNSREAALGGSLLRRVTVEDDLLLARLHRSREEAYRACEVLLIERQVPAVLVDVEHLFDGQTLLFYFLGEATPDLDVITSELAEVYEAQVQFRKFTETLTAGCGPGCGTEDAEHGCASGGCSTCQVACGSASRYTRPAST